MVKERGGLFLRLGFLVLLGGGLLFWSHVRKPRDCAVELDLTRALPGDVLEVDLIVRRDGRLLERTDLRYGTTGAPGTVRATVHAAPGGADVEATLVYAGRSARRLQARVDLSATAPAVVVAR